VTPWPFDCCAKAEWQPRGRPPRNEPHRPRNRAPGATAARRSSPRRSARRVSVARGRRSPHAPERASRSVRASPPGRSGPPRSDAHDRTSRCPRTSPRTARPESRIRTRRRRFDRAGRREPVERAPVTVRDRPSGTTTARTASTTNTIELVPRRSNDERFRPATRGRRSKRQTSNACRRSASSLARLVRPSTFDRAHGSGGATPEPVRSCVSRY